MYFKICLRYIKYKSKKKKQDNKTILKTYFNVQYYFKTILMTFLNVF